MSLTSSVVTPAGMAIKSAGNLLRGTSLPSMARAVGVALGAGLLAASYQIAYEEGRGLIHNMRVNAAHRRNRNDMILLVLLNSTLPVELQIRLLGSRDVFQLGMRMLTEETLLPEHHQIIHATLTRITNGESRDG